MNNASNFVSHALSRQGDTLFLEGVNLSTLAKELGTPLYVYSSQHIQDAFKAYTDALVGYDATVCYAVKANSNLSILKLLASLGAGFDIVSAGELTRALEAGATPSKVVFSGVGKSRSELEMALKAGVGCFNVESAPELERLSSVATELGVTAHIS